MIFHHVLGGTPEWHQIRCGAITASRVSDAISLMTRAGTEGRKIGDPTAAADRYAADLAIEIVSGKPFGEPAKSWVLERGHEMEAKARRKYEVSRKAFVTEAGICKSEEGRFGYSTDGLADDDGLIEIKAPIDSDKIMRMLATGNVSEYMHQMQTGLWITGRKYCDFIQYVPDLESVGKDLYIKRIHRDDAFIDDMVIELYRFQKMVDKRVEILRS